MKKLKFPQLYMRVRPVDIMPKGFGVAYRDMYRDTGVLVRIPFNYPVGWIRTFWLILKHGPGDSGITKAYWSGYYKGHNDLIDKIYNEATTQMMQLMLEKWKGVLTPWEEKKKQKKQQ